MICTIEFTRLTNRNFPPLIGCGQVVGGQMSNDIYFMQTLFVVWAWARLFPRNLSTKVVNR